MGRAEFTCLPLECWRILEDSLYRSLKLRVGEEALYSVRIRVSRPGGRQADIFARRSFAASSVTASRVQYAERIRPEGS